MMSMFLPTGKYDKMRVGDKIFRNCFYLLCFRLLILAHGGNNYRMEDLLNDNMSRGKEWVNSSPKSICERVKLPEKWSNNEENAEGM